MTGPEPTDVATGSVTAHARAEGTRGACLQFRRHADAALSLCAFPSGYLRPGITPPVSRHFRHAASTGNLAQRTGQHAGVVRLRNAGHISRDAFRAVERRRGAELAQLIHLDEAVLGQRPCPACKAFRNSGSVEPRPPLKILRPGTDPELLRRLPIATVHIGLPSIILP